jgi:hypothetical protein
MTITRKIFLASSAELKDDRDEFEISSIAKTRTG